jgi:hypothetical protein
MFKRALVCAAAALAAGCSVLADSNWMLFERGYSLDVAPYGDEFAIRAPQESWAMPGRLGAAALRG